MGNLHDLMLLVILGGVVATWLQLSRAREMAVLEARRLCERHGLQLLDETVGLRRLRLRLIDDQRRVERCYGFEVSLEGDDRQNGRLWMAASRVTEVHLPTIHWQAGVATPVAPSASYGAADTSTEGDAPTSMGNVVPLHSRTHHDRRRH